MTASKHTVHSAAPRAHATEQRTPRNEGRRDFFSRVGGLTIAAVVSGTGGLSALLAPGAATAAVIGPQPASTRSTEAYKLRVEAARLQRIQPLAPHPTNADDDTYPGRIGSFTKALVHNSVGEVTADSYQSYLNALSSGTHAAHEAIQLGGTVKLANVRACYSYALEGPDSHHLSIPPAPAFASAHAAADMVEVYWRALTRDLPFTDYSTDPMIAAAAADLTDLTDYRGPRSGGVVTPQVLFRGNAPGDLSGPLVSQFLWRDIPHCLDILPQRYRLPVPGLDYMTRVADWLAIQNGTPPAGGNLLDPEPRYISTGRDLAGWVQKDYPYQAFLNAGLILLSYGAGALDAGNPYRTSATQGGFVTFGAAHVLDMVARVARQALQAVWYQKWLVHRRARPEEFAGRAHFHLTGVRSYPLHGDLLDSAALDGVFGLYGTYLLPMAYPEGAPIHPSYPAGHAAIAGACTTVLKAFFKETFVIPSPVVANRDGSDLEPYAGDLTVGGELNKLAANVALARDTAGVHYRSDGVEGILLGEQVAIGILRDYRQTYHEPFGGFSLTRFDGTTIKVGA